MTNRHSGHSLAGLCQIQLLQGYPHIGHRWKRNAAEDHGTRLTIREVDAFGDLFQAFFIDSIFSFTRLFLTPRCVKGNMASAKNVPEKKF